MKTEEGYVMKIWKFLNGHPFIDSETGKAEVHLEFELTESPKITYHVGRGQVIFGDKGKFAKDLTDENLEEEPFENPNPFEGTGGFSINMSPCKRFYERSGANGLYDSRNH
jgi:hypothetical protein